MQKTGILVLLLVVAIQLFGQTERQTKSPEEYMRKSRGNKIVAWSMVAGGAAICATGLVIQINNIDKFINSDGVSQEGLSFYKGTGIAIIGAAVAITSIPFFVAGADNKFYAKRAARKAKTSFDIKQVKTLQSTGYAFIMQPTLSLKIRL